MYPDEDVHIMYPDVPDKDDYEDIMYPNEDDYVHIMYPNVSRWGWLCVYNVSRNIGSGGSSCYVYNRQNTLADTSQL